jgi:hypothetical protein
MKNSIRVCSLAGVLLGLHFNASASQPVSPVDMDSQAQQLSVDTVVQVFLNEYSDEAQKKFGTELQITWDPEDPLYFGGSSFENGSFNMGFGKEAWASEPDGFAFTLCHELGHLMGGEPKKKNGETKTWASAEGQADYFAASICLRRVLAKLNPAPKQDIPLPVKTACEIIADPNASKLCERTAMSGYRSFHQILDSVGLIQFAMPSFLKPEAAAAPITLLGYPSLQCRLDTVLAGAAGQPRPRCWFAD